MVNWVVHQLVYEIKPMDEIRVQVGCRDSIGRALFVSYIAQHQSRRLIVDSPVSKVKVRAPAAFAKSKVCM
jgi:hypothetical protein